MVVVGLLAALAIWLVVDRVDQRDEPSGSMSGGDGGSAGAPGEPYPYSTPGPERTPTPVDGTYERHISVADAGGEPVACRRCAPYRLEAGTATLDLDRGWFRVDHPAAGFRSVGHFFVHDSEIVFVNDPNCPRDRGVYRWTQEEGVLVLEPAEDPCPFDRLRARYLGAQPWGEA